jgi:hypothetical protein
MAALSLSVSSFYPSARPWGSSLQTGLRRMATAIAAVVGISAMAATHGSAGGLPGFTNGTYLYGESPVANTLGSVYLVFQVAEDQLIGALYQPSSSFDCVYGTVTSEALNLRVVDAYDQTESAYAVALTPATTAVASTSGVASMAHIEGMHALGELSTLDQQLLTTCANR